MPSFQNFLEIYIPHPQSENVLKELEFVLQHQSDTGKALGYRLTGPTNAGKTTVVKEFYRRHPPIVHAEFTEHPILYVHLPERAKLVDVYIGILRALGEPLPTGGRQNDLRYRAKDMLAKARVKMVIFDEPHHLTDARSDGARLGLTQLAKTLIDEGHIVVFAGVKSVDDLVMESVELARRFRGKLTLGAYSTSNAQHMKALRDYCNEAGRRLHYVEPIEFGSDVQWFSRMLAMSAGLVGIISQVISQAESRAKSRGDGKLTFSHFSEAWQNFASSEEEGLQHLKRKSSKHLIDVFDLADDDVLNIVGKLP